MFGATCEVWAVFPNRFMDPDPLKLGDAGFLKQVAAVWKNFLHTSHGFLVQTPLFFLTSSRCLESVVLHFLQLSKFDLVADLCGGEFFFII